ncbi:MAG: hypothetical protein ABW252_08405 [Polyangiales bacterium]
MQRRVLLGCLFLSACATGGQDDSDSEGRALVVGTKDPVTYYKDIKPIVDQKCGQCHSEGASGQFGLGSYADLKPLAAAVKESVSTGSMPPWSATGPVGQFAGDRRLTDTEASKLIGWVEQGSPEGNAADARPLNVPAPQKLSKVDLTLAVSDPYTPAAGGDDYRCYILEWTPTTNKFITGLNVVPSDKQLIRHANAYLIDPAASPDLWKRNGVDGDIGWSCMSGPTNAAWIGAYDAVGGARVLPSGLGLEVKPYSAIVLQVHYNTLHKGGADQPKVEFSLSDTSARPAQVGLIVNPVWQARGLRIPANEADVPFRYVFRPANLVRGTTYDLHAADLHMHKFGKSGSVGVVRQDGSSEPILNVASWEFGWQQSYGLAAPVRLGPQDQLFVECHFDNTAENQPIGAAPVERNWGETPNDEVCIGNVLAAAPGSAVVPDAGRPDAGRDAGPPDSGRPTVPDAGRPAVPDAGRPTVPDAGRPTVPDAGRPTVPDAGRPTQPPVRDAGRPPVTNPTNPTNPNCTGSTSVSGPGVISVGRTDLSGGSGSVTRCIR